MYEKRLGDAGYLSYKLGRTNNRGDGMFPSCLHVSLFHFRNVFMCCDWKQVCLRLCIRTILEL